MSPRYVHVTSASKKKSSAVMITGRKPSDTLQRAVVKYIEARGGNVIVIGGVEIQQWPGELPYNFTVAVKCTGIKPLAIGKVVE